jgi:hypothetical protein
MTHVTMLEGPRPHINKTIEEYYAEIKLTPED